MGQASGGVARGGTRIERWHRNLVRDDADTCAYGIHDSRPNQVSSQTLVALMLIFGYALAIQSVLGIEYIPWT